MSNKYFNKQFKKFLMPHMPVRVLFDHPNQEWEDISIGFMNFVEQMDRTYPIGKAIVKRICEKRVNEFITETTFDQLGFMASIQVDFQKVIESYDENGMMRYKKRLRDMKSVEDRLFEIEVKLGIISGEVNE